MYSIVVPELSKSETTGAVGLGASVTTSAADDVAGGREGVQRPHAHEVDQGPTGDDGHGKGPERRAEDQAQLLV